MAGTELGTPGGGPARLAGQPLAGHLHQYRRDPLGLLDRCAAAPGPVAELRIRTRAYVLKSAEDVRHVIVSNPDAYEKTPRVVGPRSGRLGGRGVFFSAAGAEHRRGRTLLRPPLGREAVSGFASGIVAATDRAIDSWPDGEGIDAESEATALAFRNMLKAIFGALPEEAPELAEGIAVRRRYLERTVRALLPRPRVLPVAISPGRRRALSHLDRAIFRMVARERSKEEPQDTPLSHLARATDTRARQPSDREIRDQLLTLGITGYMTVSAALTWTLYELARNPQVAARLEAEVDDVVGDRPPSAADLERLPYAVMVVSEVLRLYPPTWVIWRTVIGDDELPSGALLRAGAKVLLSPYLVHRSPHYYEQPGSFDPDRMALASQAGRPRFAYFPFGGGGRICVGRAFALLELALMVARLAQRVRFEPLSGDPGLDPQLNLRPRDAVEIRATRR